MTRQEAERQTRQADTLVSLGFTRDEAEALRRISMTLRRWFERECGDSNEYASFAIERDDVTEKPFMVTHSHRPPYAVTRYAIPDRETGARKRLAAIIDERNRRVCDVRNLATDHVRAFVQSDPRGAALYIIRPGDVPDGADVSSYYTRGVVVY